MSTMQTKMEKSLKFPGVFIYQGVQYKISDFAYIPLIYLNVEHKIQ